MLHISAFRFIGRGHAQRVLRRKRGPYHNRYDSFIADQRERLNSLLQKIKYEKDDAARAVLGTNRQIADLFNEEEVRKFLDYHVSSEKEPSPTAESRTDVNEAYRIHRLLRPEAPNFFEEQAFISLKERMDKVIDEHHSECFKELVPKDTAVNLSAFDMMTEPLFSDDTYALGIYALMDSLQEDMHHLCNMLQIEGKDEPFDLMLDFIKLKRDGSNVGHWANNVWPKIRPLLAEEFGQLGSKDLETWLRGHLERVNHNRSALNRTSHAEWYDIKRDMPYDGRFLPYFIYHAVGVPYPEALLDERRIGYPLDKAGTYLMSMLQLFNQSMVGGIKKDAIEDFIAVLRKIGLKDWFGLQKKDILSTFFGKSCDDATYASVQQSVIHDVILTKHSPSTCEKLINLFLHGKEDELDPASLAPSRILGDLGLMEATKEANSSPSAFTLSSVLTPKEVTNIVSRYVKKLGKLNATKIVKDYNTVFDRMIKEELEFHASVGAGKVSEEGIDYKVPAGAQFDPKRNYYVRTREGVDPTLKLENLRSCVLERRRMRTMTKEGRVYFLRVVVAVGDGNGYFGTGVGFGNDVGTARGSAVQQALRNMYFIDFDPKEPLTTPVLGREYGSKVYIMPRKMGAGIKVNRKYLPLVYLTGLDNCKVTFHGRSSWLTRAKALRKALEQIYSRKTMCNATGMKYVYVDKPGDHTVHWPDRWFIPLAKEYKDKIASLKNLKRIKFPRHAHRIVMPEEVKPEVPRYARHRFRSPLELREHDRKRDQFISNKVTSMPHSEETTKLGPSLDN